MIEYFNRIFEKNDRKLVCRFFAKKATEGLEELKNQTQYQARLQQVKLIS
jgi:hypothetical protein